MAELLLCTQNRGTTGNVLKDSHAAQVGDVVLVQANGAGWGAAELGGPTYVHYENEVQETLATINLQPSFDASAVQDIKDVEAIPDNKMLSISRSDPVVVEEAGSHFGMKVLAVDNVAKTITVSNREFVVVNEEVRSISQHPNGNHPFFRVLKLPNVSVALANSLLSTEKETDPQNPNPYLQYRGFALDLSKMKGALADFIADDTRVQQFFVDPMSDKEFQALIFQRAPYAAKDAIVIS